LVVKRLTSIGLGLVLGTFGCSKPESTATTGSVTRTIAPPSSAVTAPASAVSAAPAASATATSSAATTEAAPAPSTTAPESFAGGNKETIDNAVGQGCEARSKDGWLELLCRKKNGTGGHPVKAVLDAEANEEIAADEQGELRVTVPWVAGQTKQIPIDWTDTRYLLKVEGTTAKLEWTSGTLELRKSCAKFADESKAALTSAQKAGEAGALTAADTAKLPRFGTCQPASFGSWALGLKSLRGTGDGAARKLSAELELAFISEQGQKTTASFGTLEFAPGGLKLLPLRVYDYDDDGKHELIVPYEIAARAPGDAPALPAVIWSMRDSQIAPYAKSPSVSAGAVVEQLDFDMRPDIGEYGPFVAFLGADCGLSSCPPRITGPVLYLHSLPDGGFSRDDSAAKGALGRACPKKPEAVVVEAGGKVNAAQTAKNLVCALAWGAPKEALLADIAAKHGALCGTAESCAFESTLQKWAGEPAPGALKP
jgi:hypothetical protein